MKHPPRDVAPPADPRHPLSTEDYVRLLHPSGSGGCVALLAHLPEGETCARSLRAEEAAAQASAWLECPAAYLAVNRFAGPRSVGRVAVLSALFVDLDYYNAPMFAGASPRAVCESLHRHLADEGVPPPSVVLDSGRGLAAIWLHEPLPKAALPRWQAAEGALVGLLRPYGADPAAKDAARVLRLPGGVNAKSGRVVATIAGTLERLSFDEMADAVYRAVGRPTAKELQGRKARKGGASSSGRRTGGLSPAARFRQIEKDLKTLRVAWGGQVPRGLRNLWLHLHATALSHHADPADIPTLVDRTAAAATPDLPPCEVRSVIRSTMRLLEGPLTACPATDSRLHYAGATIAEALGVDYETAAALELRQIVPPSLRRARKAEREAARRRAKGALPRAEWLAENNQGVVRPWEAMGLRERTWRRRIRGK